MKLLFGPRLMMAKEQRTEMLEYSVEVLERAEARAAGDTVNATLGVLRELTLGEFGELLWGLPNPDYPNLSAILPKMADAHVQLNWTGVQGLALLVQTCDFVSKLDYYYLKLKGACLANAKILDYGCGYGRILRLMYYFSDPDKLWAVDPWDEAIRICQNDRLLGNLAVSKYLPKSLPVDTQLFDVIYAFSVFTHTSERATIVALATLRKYIAPDGLCAITIRPREYWSNDPGYRPAAATLERTHNMTGFAFAPHQRAPVDGDITYGDTSMTLGWLEKNVPGWKIASHDRSLNDPYQLVVFLRPI